MSKHTKEPWSQGITLITPETARWSPEQLQKNNRIEAMRVFAFFTPDDQGRGREFIAEFRDPEDAARTSACVNACAGISTELLTNLKWPLSELLKQRDELLQLLQRAAKWFINDDDAPLWVLDVRAALARLGNERRS